MLESSDMKKLVDQEIPFDDNSVPIGIYVPVKKCLHGVVICQKCMSNSVPAEKQL